MLKSNDLYAGTEFMQRYIILVILVLFFLLTRFIQPVKGEDVCGSDPILIYSKLTGEESGDNNWVFCKETVRPIQLTQSIDAISPSGRWVAHLDGPTSPFRLIIYEFNHVTPVSSILWQNTWFQNNIQWLNDDEIVISVIGDGESDQGSRVFINPFSGATRTLDVKLPNSEGWVSYDDTFERVVYRKSIEDGAVASQMVLYDVTSQKELWTMPVDSLTPPSSYYSLWSPDNSGFAYVRLNENDFELFFVNRYGLEKQLTDYSSDSHYSTVLHPHWSPDGQFIAFWIAFGTHIMPLNNLQFGILSVDTLEIRLFDFFRQLMGTFDMVWSPDSASIALIQVNDNNKQNLLILDRASNELTQIDTDVAGIETWCVCAEREN